MPRSRRHPALFCAGLLALGACATASAPPAGPELKRITVQGNKALSDSEIKDKIATTEDTHLPLTDWRLPFTEPRYLDQAVLESDTRRIARLYQVHGYFRAKVTEVKVEPIKGKSDQVTVALTVDEGQVTNVSQLEVRGLEGLPEKQQKELRGQVKLEKDKPFNEDTYEEAKAGLGQHLRDLGYAEAQVEGRVVVDPEARTAEVTLQVAPGERYQFGRIFVAGTSKVPKQQVADAAADQARPGTYYSDSAVREAQNKVFDMGVFSMAKVSRGAPDPESHTLPLVVDVREAPFHTLTVGGGLGIDPTRQEVRGRFEWINRNFFGGLRKLDFDNRLGYVVTPGLFDALRSSTNSSGNGFAGYSQLTFTQPDLPIPQVDFTSRARVERDIQIGYTYNSALINVGLTRRWAHRLEISPSYTFQLLQYIPTPGTSNVYQSRAPQLSISCPKGDPRCLLRLSYLEQRLTWDQRDNSIEPRRGYMALLDLQEGGGPFADFVYLRAQPEVRGYYPVAKMLTLAVRGTVGWMQSFNTLADGSRAPTPVTQRYFGGGSNSVRAYGSRLLSPVEVVCTKDPGRYDCSQQKYNEALPVGGNGLYEASTELRWNTGWHSLGLVAFLDAGAVPVDALKVRMQDVALAPGIGLRYFTLFGPVRLDFAYRLPTLGPDDGQLRLAPSQVVINYPPAPGSHFTLLPETNRFNFQFSIGEAF